MKTIFTSLLFFAGTMLFSTAEAYSLNCDSSNSCKVTCNNGQFAGTMYWNGSRWSDGIRSSVDKNQLAQQITAVQGAACEAQAARQVDSQQEKEAALIKNLDGGVFVIRKTFDYGTAEWAISINSGEASYSYEIIEFASDSTVPANVRGTWRQILMNSGYSGEKMSLASGKLSARQFTIIRSVSTPSFEAGSMTCEVSTDRVSITCFGDLIEGKTWTFQRK